MSTGIPALYLTPLEEHGEGGIARYIHLIPGGERVIIGRAACTSEDQHPRHDNLLFASGTFSRKHAEVWLTPANEVCSQSCTYSPLGADDAWFSS